MTAAFAGDTPRKTLRFVNLYLLIKSIRTNSPPPLEPSPDANSVYDRALLIQLALATRADKLSRTFFDSLDRAPLSASDSWTLSDLLKDFLLNQNPTPRTEGEETSGYLYSELNGSDTAEFIRTTITLCLAETISDDLVENPPKDLEVFLKLLKRDKEKDSEFMTQLRETEGRARRYTFLADYADQRHSYP